MVIKQIYFDEDTGRLMLSDNDNNHYLCNLYGDKLTEFVPGLSGVASQKERVNFEHTYSISNKQYLPSIRHFEGYSHFPQPKVPPLDNIKSSNKDKLISLLKNNFQCEKVLELFNVKTNKGLPYLSGQLVKDESKKNRFRLIKLIDDYFEEYKKSNKYKEHLMPKDPVIKALKRFKKHINENIDINVVHGRPLNSPSEYIQKKYKEVTMKIQKRKIHLMNNNQPRENLFTAESIKDDLSFLSHESSNDAKYAQSNIIRVKDNNFFKNSLDVEKKYIQGFKPAIKKEEGIIQKALRRQLKTNGELYLQDMKLFKEGINC
jgi:ribosomal protein S21